MWRTKHVLRTRRYCDVKILWSVCCTLVKLCSVPLIAYGQLLRPMTVAQSTGSSTVFIRITSGVVIIEALSGDHSYLHRRSARYPAHLRRRLTGGLASQRRARGIERRPQKATLWNPSTKGQCCLCTYSASSVDCDWLCNSLQLAMCLSAWLLLLLVFSLCSYYSGPGGVVWSLRDVFANGLKALHRCILDVLQRYRVA